MWYTLPALAQSEAPPSSGSSRSLERKLQRVVTTNSSPRAFLLVVEEARAGRLYLLADNELVIGRGPAVDVKLGDPSVSQEHARISPRGDGYLLLDMGSTNGVTVNGRRVAEHRLRRQDRIEIGSTSLLFLEESASDSTVTVALQREFDGVTTSERIGPRVTPLVPAREQEENPIYDVIRKAVLVGRFLRRHVWVMLALPMLGLAAGFYTVRRFPPPEMAEATVKLVHYKTVNPMEGGDPRFRGEPVFFQDPETNFVEGSMVRATMERLRPQANEQTIAAAVAGLSIEAGRDGRYTVNFAQPPTRPLGLSSVAFLEAYLESYLSHEIDEAIRALKSEAEFLDNELGDVADELKEVEDELLRYRSDHIDSLPEQAGAVIASKQMLTDKRTEYELEVERLRAQAQTARGDLSQASSFSSQRYQEAKPLQEQLQAKRREVATLKAKGLRDDHPEVRALNAEIGQLDRDITAKLGAQVSDAERANDPEVIALTRAAQQYERELRVAERGLAQVESQLGTAASRIAKVPEVEATVGQLSWRQESLQALRRRLFEQHRKTLVQIDLETANVRSRYTITMPAHLQSGASAKFWVVRLGGGLAGGLFLALLIAGGIEISRLVRKHPELLRVN